MNLDLMQHETLAMKEDADPFCLSIDDRIRNLQDTVNGKRND